VPVRAPVAAAPSSPASAPSSPPSIAARAAVVSHARRIISRRVVVRREILWCGRVRLRLAFLQIRRLAFRTRTGTFFAFFRAVVLTTQVFSFGGVAVLRVPLIEVDYFFVHPGSRKRFAGQQLDRGSTRLPDRSRSGWLPVSVPVFVILKVFEYVAHVQESVAIQADVDEG